jgi:hypothetical protein
MFELAYSKKKRMGRPVLPIGHQSRLQTKLKLTRSVTPKISHEATEAGSNAEARPTHSQRPASTCCSRHSLARSVQFEFLFFFTFFPLNFAKIYGPQICFAKLYI